MLEGILRARPDAIVSVDTYKAATARAALRAGAEIVNDVSGFGWDAEMAAVCAGARCGVVLMHTRGRPEEWRAQAPLESDELLELGRPLLAGVSRKSFLGRALAPLRGGSDAPVEARETAGVAALVAAIMHGASIVRVHAVRQAAEAACIADAMLAAG